MSMTVVEKRELILTCLSKGSELVADGHEVYPPEFYIEKGWDERLVTPCVSKHGGGRDWKGWIDGDPDKIIEGVYALDFIRLLFTTLGAQVEGVWPQGRGTLARKMATAILNRAKEFEAPESYDGSVHMDR